MKAQEWSSLFNRIFFVVAFLTLMLAIVEKIFNLAGYTIVGGQYTPGRLFEFSAILLLFVIALLLRNIREELRRT
jgi:hypothetical protein